MSQIAYPNEPGTITFSVPGPRFYTRATYWALGGGSGAPPLAIIGGGSGAPPLAIIGGGSGAPPLAIIGGGSGAPPLADVTTVFRLIAPTKTSMARSSALSLRDIESLQGEITPETLYT